MSFSKRELTLLILIVLLGAFLRLYRLDEVPPGLHGDTAYKGVAANRILDGEHPIFFAESWGGIEPLYMYMLAASFYLFGSTALVIQGLSAAVGIITIPLLHLLCRDLLRSRLVGLLASFWLATSYWHVSWSRLGWESILVPPFVIVTVWLLWHALETRKLRFFIGAGVSLGLSLYSYQGMRFLPIFIAVYLAYRVLTERGFWRALGARVTAFAVIALLVFAPLGGYFVTHPDTFLRRAGEVSIFNPEKNPHGPLRSLLTSAVKIAGMYNLRGDPLWRHNLPGRPALDPLTSACFLIGLGVSVAKRREPAYPLLLLWLVVMSLPPVLTPPRDVPHFTRSIGALPAACILPAIGVRGAWEWVRTRRPSRTVGGLFWASVSAILVAAALLTYRDYFVLWASNRQLRNQYFDGQFVDVATAMNELGDPEGVWVLPISSLASPHDEPGHHTIEFLYSGQAPFYFLRLEEATAADALSRLSRGHKRAFVVEYKNYVIEDAHNYIDADPKELVPFLLSKYGQQLARHEFDSFDVLVYELPQYADFSIAEGFKPVSIDFGGELLLRGVYYTGYPDYHRDATHQTPASSVPSGEPAWVVLQWESLRDLSADYKVALYLLDEKERVAGQVDKILLSNRTRLTSDWTGGQLEMDYYVLPSWPATPPGDYRLEVAVYDLATMQRLPVLDTADQVVAHSYSLGQVEIAKPLSLPVVQPGQLVPAEPMTSQVRLLGYDLPETEVGPGEAVEVALYWEALSDVENDYTVLLQVRDEQGLVWGEEQSRPAYGSYPTTQWEKGEIIRDWHEVPIRAETPHAAHGLYVALLESQESVSELKLDELRVSGRARSYEIPAMDHELGWSLGEGIRLLGYDVGESVKAGETLELTLYWQCVAEMDESYTVFTHLLDPDNVMRGQMDSIPAEGAAPTTSWLRREVITDRHVIAVAAESLAGEYVLEIGMYDASTMIRLPVYSCGGKAQGDRILLETIHVHR